MEILGCQESLGDLREAAEGLICVGPLPALGALRFRFVFLNEWVELIPSQ